MCTTQQMFPGWDGCVPFIFRFCTMSHNVRQVQYIPVNDLDDLDDLGDLDDLDPDLFGVWKKCSPVPQDTNVAARYQWGGI